MGAFIIKVGGFDEVSWEARVGVGGRRLSAAPASVIVKGNGRTLEAWLLQLEKQLSKPVNQNGANG